MSAGDPRQGIRLGLMSTGGFTVGLDVTCVAEVCPVRDVSPLLTAAPGLLGAIDLRGHPIPLFDPLRLAGLAPHGATPRIAVVAARDGRRVALGFDAIEGLIRVPCNRLERHAGTEAAFFAGTIETGGRIVSVVEPRALLSRPDIPIASAPQAGVRGSAAAQPVLTFDAGGARFGIGATGVEATVPRQQIEPESLAEGAWLGIIRHHGRRVPVMHLNAVLGIGEVKDLRMAEVVIVRFPDRRLVGFAVEAIRRMQHVSLAAARPVPAMLAAGTLGIRQVVPGAADCDTFLIDLPTLWADETLCGMASLSDEKPDATPAPAVDRDGARAERSRYLVARAGAPVAIPIREVARIVMPPPQVTPLARAPDWVTGVFREHGATVPLIDLGHRLGHGRTEVSERTRVLLAGSREALTGFTLGSVDHLEWSAWRSDRAGGDGMVAGLVGFPRLGAQGVLPFIDLARFEGSARHG